MRAAFALIEGFTALLKHAALAEYQAGRCSLSHGEISILSDRGYHLSNGKVNERVAFYPLEETIRFAFSIFARAHGLAIEPDYKNSN